ncbi:hypothetical protein WUBG_15234, partial [Wuchereria bancrofti]
NDDCKFHHSDGQFLNSFTICFTLMNNSMLNNNSGINGNNDDVTAMDTWEDRRISITLQYGSLKEVLVLERSDNPQVNVG